MIQIPFFTRRCNFPRRRSLCLRPRTTSCQRRGACLQSRLARAIGWAAQARQYCEIWHRYRHMMTSLYSKFFKNLQILVRRFAPLGKGRCTYRNKFRLHLARSTTDCNSSVRQHIDRHYYFCHDYVLAIGNHHNGCQQSDLRRR